MPTPIAPIQVPIINGVVYAFAQVIPKINGVPFSGGVKSIKYSRKRSREMVYSNNPDPVGKTMGQNEYTASIELYLQWYQVLQSNLLNGNDIGYGDIFFDVAVAYGFANGPVVQDYIQGCTLDTTEADQSTGPAALTRTIELNPLKIYFADADDLAFPLQTAQ